MKFVHIADLHLDTPFTNLDSKNNLGKMRRLDQRKALKEIVNYIKENNIPYLFISGDLYENEYIRRSTIEYINELFKEIENTQIFITPGNHDPYLKNSMYNTFNWNKNVKIFNSNIECVKNNDVDIYGVGFADFYATDLGIRDIEIENKNKLNILITHGSLNESDKQQLQYNPLNERMLQKFGFDYVALGHIHKPYFNEYENQRIVYPGSTVSLGFDELGNHGFIVGELTKDNIKLKFIPLDNKEFKELEFDVTDLKDIDELIEKINLLKVDENIFYKIILIGKRKFEINTLEISKFIENENIIKIKDNTVLDFDLQQIANENTLKGIFVNEIIEENKKNNLTQEELNKILEIGLSVLN